MRKSSPDRSLPRSLEEISSEFSLWKCHQCGQCSAVCPSGRHGGIKVGEMMSRAATGSLDLRSEKTVWLCTMCQSCSERCEAGVNPAEVLTVLRNACAELGNRPSFFGDEAKRYIETGLCFPKTGLTKKMRAELGLGDIGIDSKAVDEIKIIAKKARLKGVENGT